jgi:L-iditol 2-dehydrogenase
VLAIGEKVTNLKVGDRVAVEPSILCLTCDFAEEADITCARYQTHILVDYCRRMAVCVDTILIHQNSVTSNSSNGHNVLVCGAGAAKVFITDINQSRLGLAKKMGADGTYCIDLKTFKDSEFAQFLCKEVGDSPDTILEYTGVESSLSTAIYATKSGGKICLIGLGPLKVKVPLS